MKRFKRGIQFVCIVWVCFALSGCICFAYPDPSQTVTITKGSTQIFSAINDSQGYANTWYLNGMKMSEAGVNFTYLANTLGSDIVKVMDPSGDTRTWNITVVD